MKNYIVNPGFIMSGRNAGKSRNIDLWGPDTKHRINIPHSREDVSKQDREMIHLAIQALNRMHIIVDLQVSMMMSHGPNGKSEYVGWRFNIPNRIEF